MSITTMSMYVVCLLPRTLCWPLGYERLDHLYGRARDFSGKGPTSRSEFWAFLYILFRNPALAVFSPPPLLPCSAPIKWCSCIVDLRVRVPSTARFQGQRRVGDRQSTRHRWAIPQQVPCTPAQIQDFWLTVHSTNLLLHVLVLRTAQHRPQWSPLPA